MASFPSERGRLLAQPADLVCGHGASEALQIEFAGRGRLDGVLHGCEEALPDQDLAGSRLGAEPRSEIRNGPEDAVVVVPYEPDSTDRRVADLDADAESQLRSTLSPNLSQLREPLLGGEREPDGLKLVICDASGSLKKTINPSPAKCSSVPSYSGMIRRAAIGVFRVVTDVRDVDRLTFHRCPAGGRRSVESMRMLPVVRNTLGLGVVCRHVYVSP